MTNGFNYTPLYSSAHKTLVKYFGGSPITTDDEYKLFAQWLEKDNPMLYTIMVCAYFNSVKNALSHKLAREIPKCSCGIYVHSKPNVLGEYVCRRCKLK